jgi:hypothetical protein
MAIEIRLTFWANKEGATIKTWKKRWFVLLSDGRIRYFDAEDSTTQRGEIVFAPGNVFLSF